jgi:hypothetical protein
MDGNFDWSAYVSTMAALHGLELNPARHAEIVEQLQRVQAIAQPLLDFPLPANIELASSFQP